MPQQQQGNKPNPAPRGVTLVEIAIVLVIIGLLLGGVLKGQELINGAKVRSIADRQLSIKVAWYAFVSRYQAMPGDYVFAEQNIPGAGKAFTAGPVTGDGVIEQGESPIAFQNMTGAGFLRCPQCTAQVEEGIRASNSLQNSYGGVIATFHNGIVVAGSKLLLPTYSSRGATNQRSDRLMSHSGPLIPSNIAAEVDRKLDDGIANDGDVVFNTFFTGNAALSPTNACITDAAGKQVDAKSISSTDTIWWRHSSAPVEANCGFSVKL